MKFPTLDAGARGAVTRWLLLALAALIASGLYSVLLVASRTPGVQEYIPWIDFFHTALVVHVDLSVLIWFLSFAGVIWSAAGRCGQYLWEGVAFWLVAAGTAVITFAPFLGAGDPLMNNYVPVLQHPLFFAGLLLVGAGFTLLVLGRLAVSVPRAGGDDSEVAIYTSIVAAAVAVAALVLSWVLVPGDQQPTVYFEYLFWGGGHVIQFADTLLMLIAWIWLAQRIGAPLAISSRVTSWLFVLTVVPVLAAPLIYLLYGAFSLEFRHAFTELMIYGGLACVPLCLIMLRAFVGCEVDRSDGTLPIRNALSTSMFLFATGGVLGFMIEGVNVVIPAHYHGSIVGVTLAFMGLTYLLLPKLGFGVPNSRMARWQPLVYGGGQLMHILGLAWSGGYGVQRKAAGAAQGLDTLAEKLGMGMMGLGGLIAIIGGILFLIVAIRSLMARAENQ